MHIALVESSRAVQFAIVELLQPRGHQISVFNNPRKALDWIAADETVEAVITAAELAPISGIELCWEARLLAGGRRPLYIMLMTSNVDERTMIECLDIGCRRDHLEAAEPEGAVGAPSRRRKKRKTSG